VYVESLPHKLTHKLHTSKNLWTPWRWPTTKIKTWRNNNL